MCMPHVRSYEEIKYKGRLALLMTLLYTDGVPPNGTTLDLLCGGSTMREKWFIDNHVC